ncbi:MAG: hypothetical protein ACOYK1_03705 [Vampirovibrionia bacterium]
MDNSSSSLSSINNSNFSHRIRDPRLKPNISSHDFLNDSNRIIRTDRFLHIVDDYSRRLEEYGTRMQVSTATISKALGDILLLYPNQTFTYDELFNYVLEAMNTKNLLNKPLLDESTRIKPAEKAIHRDEYSHQPIYKDFSHEINLVSAAGADREQLRLPKALIPEDRTNFDSMSKNVLSNKNFASWLLASPPALASMMTKRDYTNMLSAMMNKNVLDKSSPLFIAQMGSLVAQLLKLKQGKTNTTAGIEEERKLEEIIQEDKVSSAEHTHSIVDSVKDVINTIPIKSVKDFLLEAERFVEEEIALFYSIQKSIEREILNQVKKKVENQVKKKVKK